MSEFIALYVKRYDFCGRFVELRGDLVNDDGTIVKADVQVPNVEKKDLYPMLQAQHIRIEQIGGLVFVFEMPDTRIFKQILAEIKSGEFVRNVNEANYAI